MRTARSAGGERAGPGGSRHVTLVLASKLRLPAGRVGDPTAAILRIVGIKNLAIKARFRHTEPVAGAGDGREVTDHNQVIGRVTTVAQECDHRAVGIVEVNPFKTLPFKIHFTE